MVSTSEHSTGGVKTLADKVWPEMPIFAATGGTEESCQACLGRNNYRVNKNIVTCEAAVMVFYLAKAYRFAARSGAARLIV
jgi:dihydroxyacetone kinase DhaKLM complex PTS-EIIA-like component DhaM